MFQRLSRYPTSVRIFRDLILFMAGLQPSWKHGQQWPAIIVDGKGPSPGFGTGSPSVSMNTEPPSVDKEPTLNLYEDTADSGGSPKLEVFVVHPGSVAARIKDRKCKIRGGVVQASYKDKACTWKFTTFSSSFFVTCLPDVFELKDANACHLKIFTITPLAWKNHLDNYMDVELLDLHDRCYARQAFLDNAVNRRSRELLQVIEKIKGECDVMKQRERAWEEECEELRGYQVNLSALELKVASLEADKARLEAVEASLKKEVDDVKHDRMEVVSKVVPYTALELIHSDKLGRLVGKLVSSAVLYERCVAFEQVADMEEPFDLSKVKGYLPSYKEHTKAGNELATATFPWLSEFVADPSAPIKVLLSKKPLTLQRYVPSKTQVPVPSFQRATPSSALASNLMSPPAVFSSVQP
ncbi:hypothetical protein Tco_0222125 [Tanacetum coccineum]